MKIIDQSSQSLSQNPKRLGFWDKEKQIISIRTGSGASLSGGGSLNLVLCPKVPKDCAKAPIGRIIKSVLW